MKFIPPSRHRIPSETTVRHWLRCFHYVHVVGRRLKVSLVHRTYVDLGTPHAAVREFDALAPFVVEMLAMREDRDAEAAIYSTELCSEMAMSRRACSTRHTST